MDGSRVSVAESSTDSNGRRKKREIGPALIDRGGYWYVNGTLREAGRKVLIRQSTQLRATEENRTAAEAAFAEIIAFERAKLRGDIVPIPAAIAVDQFLHRPNPLIDRRVFYAVRDIAEKFQARILSKIGELEWREFVNVHEEGNQPQSRERFITAVRQFLFWCLDKDQRYIAAMPELPYPPKEKRGARLKHRRARRVMDLTPQLIMLMIEHAAPHMRAQMVAEWCTGGRVSSVLFDCRVCDVQLIKGRGQITFLDTKPGEPVTASLNDWAVEELLGYAEHRGRLEDREGPFFLTDENVPYKRNVLWGGNNKTAWRRMRARTVVTIRRQGAAQALMQWRRGDRAAAWSTIAKTKDITKLVRSVTQHWFRHLLASIMMTRGDVKAVMEQGGWFDIDSLAGYVHDVPQHRRKLVDSLPVGPAAAVTVAAKLAQTN